MSKMIEHNVETGEITEIELSAKDLSDAEKADKEFMARRIALETQKQSILDRLGLSAEEAALLLK